MSPATPLGPAGIIDLAALPDPTAVEPLDFEQIAAAHRAELLARHPAAADVLALESEPLTKLIEAHAWRELLYRARVNDSVRAHLLAYATGADLDHLAALFGLTRMTSEGDARLRLRVQLRVAALAGNGTREHYELTALSASARVRAAAASAPAPGRVQVVLWLHAGAPELTPEEAAAADAATLATVSAALLAPAARMLGVALTAALARAHPMDVHARFWRRASARPDLAEQLQQRLQAAFATTAALGRAVSRSWITTVLHAPGVAAIEYVSAAAPAALTELAPDEYPQLASVQLTDAGVL